MISWNRTHDSRYIPWFMSKQSIAKPIPNFKNGCLKKTLLANTRYGEGSYLPNCQTTLVFAIDAMFLLFCIFINTTAYHLGRYES